MDIEKIKLELVDLVNQINQIVPQEEKLSIPKWHKIDGHECVTIRLLSYPAKVWWEVSGNQCGKENTLVFDGSEHVDLIQIMKQHYKLEDGKAGTTV